MGKLLAKERQKEIVEYINSTGSAKIGDLADKFEVTKETIRRDLTHLQEIGAIERSHGGATLVSSFRPIPIETRVSENSSDRKSTRLNSSHSDRSRMPSSA